MWTELLLLTPRTVLIMAGRYIATTAEEFRIRESHAGRSGTR
jgi:hypothetical protein